MNTARQRSPLPPPAKTAAAALVVLILCAWPPASAQSAVTPSGAESEAHAKAVPTRVMVRVVAQGAKVLGDGVGGARVTIRDLSSGEVLARGIQRGGTGDTERIMRQAHVPGDTLYATPGTAGYEATLMLDEPTRVEIIGEGPLGYPAASRRAATTMLLVPGRDVLGDGVVLTVHGFLVELLEPGADASAPDASAPGGDSLHVRAKVTMMCGCPTTPGGLWDAGEIDVTVRLVRGGAVLAEAPLRYAGTASTYVGALPRPAGEADLQGGEVQVVAAEARGANFGMARRTLSSETLSEAALE